MDDYKISSEINAVSFQEWMTATFSVIETYILLQIIDDRN